MQEVTTYPKTELKLRLRKRPQEILEIWERARGIWKNKKTEPIEHLEKARKEWEKENP